MRWKSCVRLLRIANILENVAQVRHVTQAIAATTSMGSTFSRPPIAFDRADAAHKAAALACLRDSDLVDDAVKEGYCQYRMHLALMGQVAATYGWNDGALMKSNERLKDALDPSGSLVPGRCGIWRRRYRGHGLEMKRESGGRSEGDAVDPAEQPV